MIRHAKVDGTGLLLEWGLSDYGGQGIQVDDAFTFAAGTVRWNGAAWIAVVIPPSVLASALDAALSGGTPTLAQIKAVFQAWRSQVS